jgi:hypothetical protein
MRENVEKRREWRKRAVEILTTFEGIESECRKLEDRHLENLKVCYNEERRE